MSWNFRLIDYIIFIMISFSLLVIDEINQRSMRLEKYFCEHSVVEYSQGDKSSLILQCEED